MYEPGEKGCTGCDRMLSVNHFHIDNSKPSGLTSRCKDCRRMGDETEPAEPAEPAESAVKKQRLEADLYVMALSTDPTGAVHGLKVGRSSNIQQRALALSESMPFNITVLATFPGAGHLERRVHSMLDESRNAAGRGREWFHASLPHVIHTVACVMVG